MRWLWIDRIVAIEPGRRLVAIKHVTQTEEHLRDHFPASARNGQASQPIMPASLVLEGAAQAAGILVAAAQAYREKVILAKISHATLELDAQPGDTIRFDAQLERLDEAGASARVLLAIAPSQAPAYPAPAGSVQLLFSHIDKNLSGKAFPEENFVIGESFRTLLRTSGLPLPEELDASPGASPG